MLWLLRKGGWKGVKTCRRSKPRGVQFKAWVYVESLGPKSVESALRVSLVNNGLVGPYSATVLVTLPSTPDHRPPRLESSR
ncbi:hypothetical protein TNCV_5072681 [Trichonephila clavipes]|nr:hypothetical protein TNCV_5072681 [Trichonephila clavipes]